ncbi:hypothetical protein PBI_SCTP2_76 [Salicola phage SCTP-2]|nr:hypothetical protein PBI_SCTP2_76 [Salicola phage SCTP-2]
MIKKASILNYDFRMELSTNSIIIHGNDNNFNIICARIISKKLRISQIKEKNRITINDDNTVSIILTNNDYKKMKLGYFNDFPCYLHYKR